MSMTSLNATGDRSTMTEQSFNELYAYAYPLVYRYIARRVRQDVDDIAIEVFATAWRRREKLTIERDQQMLWLYGVARRKVANAVRMNKRKSQFVKGLQHEQPDETSTDTKAVAALVVNAALSRMKVSERELLLLVEADGLNVAEASRVLGLNQSLTQKRLASAKANFIKFCEMGTTSVKGPLAARA